MVSTLRPTLMARENARVAKLLNIILKAALIITFATGILNWFVRQSEPRQGVVFGYGVAFIVLSLLFLLLRSGWVRVTGITFVVCNWAIVAAVVLYLGGVRTTAFANFALIITVAGLLLGIRGSVVTSVATLIFGGVLVWLEINGRLALATSTTVSSALFGYLPMFALIPVYVYLAQDSYLTLIDEIHHIELGKKSAELFRLRTEELEREVAERKRIEVALRQAKEEAERAHRRAETASRAKSQFLSSMSHELRTPLNGILGYIQILKRRPPLSDSQIKGLNIIEQSGQHLLALINDILDLAKIEAGKVDLAPAAVTLPKFVEEILQVMSLKAHEKELELIYLPDPLLPEMVWLDAKRLRQVLLNLLSNAIKFTEQGHAALTIRRQQQKGLPSDQIRLRFSVRDSGIGIPPAQQAFIFQPFEQVADQQTNHEGVGLGLAISQSIVEAMGGEIQFESRPGQGSRFWFEIDVPVLSAHATQGEERQTRQVVGYEGVPRHILLVDDNEVNRSLLKSLLIPLGFELLEAGNGEAGVSLALVHQPDLILMDLIMPVLSGWEATRRIRQEPTMAAIPVIAISANADAQTIARSKEAGCIDFLPKPIDLDALLALLQQHLILNWIYDGADVVSRGDEAEIMLPEPVLLAELHQLALIGDLMAVGNLLEELARADAQYLPFVQRLQRIVDAFDEELLAAELESYRAMGGHNGS